MRFVIKDGKPDVANMSLAQVMDLREFKRQNEKVLNDLPFTLTTTQVCCSCGKSHYETVKTVDGVDRIITEPIRTLPVEDIGVICYGCFAAYWCKDSTSPNTFSLNPAIPRSQSDYDGGRFHSGEW